MHIIAVDDEHLALKNVERAIREALADCDLHCFNRPDLALEHAKKSRVDLAFLDVKMGGMDGLALAKKLKEIHAKTNIIFSSGYDEYAVDSYAIPACGYIIKPVTAKAVWDALAHLRNPVVKTDAKLRVQCFGNFDVFMGAYPLYFPRSKAKELFAYLIHKRGGSCTIQELITVLFEDREDNCSFHKQIQTIISTMIKVLREVDAEDVIIKKHNSIAVDAEKINCDYYRFLKSDMDAIKFYTGEYMTNYSWAELTVGYLNRVVL